MLPKTIQFGQEPWNDAPQSLPLDFNFDQSQAGLAHSQSMVDQMRTDAAQAKAAADQAQSAGGIAQETVKGASGVLPAAGAIAGGLAGGALGGLAASPTILGIPAGVIAGGVAGAGVGAAGGEALQEKIVGGKVDPSQVAKTGLAYGALEMFGGPAAKLVGKGLKGIGGALAKMFIPTSEREAGLLQTYKANNPFWKRVGDLASGGSAKPPTTAASTAFDKGLVGTESGIGIRAKRASTNLWTKIVSPALKQSKEKVDMPAFFKDAETQIVKDTPELGDRADRLQALESLKAEYANTPTATLDDLQGFKEGWASHVPQKAYKGQDITATYNNVRAELANQARQKIYSALGDNVKQAYFDYGNLKSLQALGKTAMAGSKFKGGFGGFWSGIKEMALVPVGTVGGQVIYKTGQGVEFIGSPGAKNLGMLLGIPAGFSPDASDQTSDPSATTESDQQTPQ